MLFRSFDARPAPPRVEPDETPAPAAGQAILATWHQLVDLGALQDGDEHLAGTARPSVARMSKSTATALGVADGDAVAVSTERGAITLPAVLVDDMAEGVVWLPTNSPGSTVRRTLGVTAGAVVSVASGGVSVASGGVASGGVASGDVASGSVSVASGGVSGGAGGSSAGEA